MALVRVPLPTLVEVALVLAGLPPYLLQELPAALPPPVLVEGKVALVLHCRLAEKEPARPQAAPTRELAGTYSHSMLDHQKQSCTR